VLVAVVIVSVVAIVQRHWYCVATVLCMAVDILRVAQRRIGCGIEIAVVAEMVVDGRRGSGGAGTLWSGDFDVLLFGGGHRHVVAVEVEHVIVAVDGDIVQLV